ncbi:DUF1330 domain-containing protein [Occallatibacter riparius]|uniref:DUF1330 domain-containing protein n=1 Tax=Occallatibacter riparius TaxID=1002689 RepID=A0A9J7BIN0_9BACT|nr:DUF1330 domain-containing protein [Occallatibacter riparius]UWZ82543.1 DUF1330 domain-containing protein [Occallatibacter riparius]
MKTYLVNHLRIPGDIPNAQAVDYLAKVEATVEPFHGRFLAMGPLDVLEGAWPGAVVLMEFPDRNAATAWYNSAEYQAIIPLRKNNSINDLGLIDGLPDGFTVKGYAEGIRSSLAK